MIDWKKITIWMIAGAVPLVISWGSFVTVAVLKATATIDSHTLALEEAKDSAKLLVELRTEMAALKTELRLTRQHLLHLEANQ